MKRGPISGLSERTENVHPSKNQVPLPPNLEHTMLFFTTKILGSPINVESRSSQFSKYIILLSLPEKDEFLNVLLVA
jgi:hypothetical protein